MQKLRVLQKKPTARDRDPESSGASLDPDDRGCPGVGRQDPDNNGPYPGRLGRRSPQVARRPRQEDRDPRGEAALRRAGISSFSDADDHPQRYPSEKRDPDAGRTRHADRFQRGVRVFAGGDR